MGSARLKWWVTALEGVAGQVRLLVEAVDAAGGFNAFVRPWTNNHRQRFESS
jgi:hypothetical protein